jgi:hypothetical protein
MTQKIQRCTQKFHQKCTNQIYIYILKKKHQNRNAGVLYKKGKNKIICIKIQ